MWDTTNNNNHSKTIFNAPATGIIQKSNKNSFFQVMHQTSSLANDVFATIPKLGNKPITVLQILLSHNGYVFVELIYTENLCDTAEIKIQELIKRNNNESKTRKSLQSISRTRKAKEAKSN